jgi:hypothetical protein
MYLLGQAYNNLEVRYMADEDVDSEIAGVTENKTNLLCGLILQLAKIRKRHMTKKHKKEFINYFYNYKKDY